MTLKNNTPIYIMERIRTDEDTVRKYTKAFAAEIIKCTMPYNNHT